MDGKPCKDLIWSHIMRLDLLRFANVSIARQSWKDDLVNFQIRPLLEVAWGYIRRRSDIELAWRRIQSLIPALCL